MSTRTHRAAPGFHVLTWNVFHLRDGRTPPTADLASTVLFRPRHADGYVHLNRKHLDQMGALLRSADADAVLLQEVPPTAIPALARHARMHAAVAVRTGPWLGSTALRGRLGAANPDLWRTHEGNANVILLGPRVRPIPGSATVIHLNPRPAALQAALRQRLSPAEVLRWMGEPRRAIAVTVSLDAGDPVTLVCSHLHGARTEWQAMFEIRRLAEWVTRQPHPVVLGGDLNAAPGHPGLRLLAEAGLDTSCGETIGIDRILVRGLRGEPENRWPTRARTIRVWLGGRSAWLRLSDHDPVSRRLETPGHDPAVTGRAGEAAPPSRP